MKPYLVDISFFCITTSSLIYNRTLIIMEQGKFGT